MIYRFATLGCLFACAVGLALTGCGGGGSGSSSSNLAGGGGRGSVRLEVPFATQLSNGKLAAFPSSVDHVEVQLFGPGVPPGQVQLVSRGNPTAAFPDVSIGEKWLMAVAMKSSARFFELPTTGAAQRVLRTGLLNDVFSIAAIELDVHEGDNFVQSTTIGGVASETFVFGGPRSVGGHNGLELARTDPEGTRRELITSDTNGVYFAGGLNAGLNAFTSTQTPPGVLLPLPANPGMVVSQNITQTVTTTLGTTTSSFQRAAGYNTVETLSTPLGTSEVLRQRTLDATPLVGGGSRLKIQDIWLRRGFGPVLITTRTIATGVDPGGETFSFSRALKSAAKRQTNATPAVTQVAESDSVEVMLSRTPGTLLSGAAGTDLGVGSGTIWSFLVVDRN